MLFKLPGYLYVFTRKIQTSLPIFFTIVFLFLSGCFFSQKGSANYEKLAIQHLELKEYDKAITYLDDLYDKNPDTWYLQYFKALMELNEFSKAEKITKKQLKANKYSVQYNVYLGKIYKAEGNNKKEKEAYEKAIKDLTPIQPFVLNLANVFIEEQLFDYAIEVYVKAAKATPEYPYFYEKADIYKLKGNTLAMINEYLDALDFRESELETIQMHLQNSLGYDDQEGGIKNPLLKQELQKRIQKDPNKLVFSEFLIFILKQQKEFNAAFIQCRALDKRLKEEGQRVFDLGKICVSNLQWATAKLCFDYVVEKGPKYMFYDKAIVEGLTADYLYITQQPEAQAADLLSLEGKLSTANDRYKETPLNAQLLKNLVCLKAFYLNKAEEAIFILEDFLSATALDVATKAEYKLLLGDIYLVKGEIWEASLLYSQVEKDFKYETIGQEAKFKNAKLSFYAGDFAWAKTQADILKGATSKLIANDALDLSLIITDAIGVDTNDAPLKLFASADLLILQHRFKEAMTKLDSINLLFSTHTLGDDIYFKKAQINLTLRNYKESEEMYKNILEYFPTDLYGDDAQFKLAELYELFLLDKEKAKQSYQDVLTNYAGSIYSVEARKRYRDLRGDQPKN